MSPTDVSRDKKSRTLRPLDGQSVPLMMWPMEVKVSQCSRTHPSEMHHQRDATSKGHVVQRDTSSEGHVVQGTRRTSDTLSKGHVVQGTRRPRDTSSKGHVVQGMEHLRLFVRGHIGRGRDNIARKKEKAKKTDIDLPNTILY